MFKNTLLALLLSTGIATPAIAESKIAIFAGGCFWCIESDFENVKGVTDVVSGYSGGITDNPTYKTHVSGNHREVVKITFDDAVVSYDKLLYSFWRSVDPTDGGGQFCDRGHSYTTAIYAVDEEQFKIAEASKLATGKELKDPIVTPILNAAKFYPAEKYHQDYYKKNPLRYSFYRRGCRRDDSVEAIWGDQAHAGIEKH